MINPTTIPTHFHNRIPLRGKHKFILMPLVAAVILAIAILWRTENPPQPPQIAPLVAIELSDRAAAAQFEARLQRNPEDVQAHALLGRALLLQVRESGDSALYAEADAAFEGALNRDPNNLDAIIGKSILAAALHDFEGAIQWANEARTINPWRAETLGILVDAYVELGRYEEAIKTAQEMVDLRPGLDSYSRVSYIRELHGDMDGAIKAMQAAVDAGVPGTEPVLWSQVQLANLYLSNGDFEAAEQTFQALLADKPDYLFGQAELAHLKFQQGDYPAAAAIFEAVKAQLPLPEIALDLLNVYEAMGKTDLADQQRELFLAMQQSNEDAGMNVDEELAAFEVMYGTDPQKALALAQLAYESTPNIFAADTLAWAHYQNGQYDEAKRYSDEALRLGTKDPTLHEHAAEIKQALLQKP